MFWTRFETLCQQNGFTPNGIAKELGIPSGSITAWKSGAKPRANTVVKIAKRFNISVDYLLGKEDIKKAPIETDEDLSGVEFALYGETRDLSDDEMDDVLNYIRFVKSKRR